MMLFFVQTYTIAHDQPVGLLISSGFFGFCFVLIFASSFETEAQWYFATGHSSTKSPHSGTPTKMRD